MRTQNWRWLAALCLLLIMLAGGRQLTALDAAGPRGQADPSVVPLRLGDWQGTEIPVSAAELARLERIDEIRRVYVNSAGERVSVAVVYSSKWQGLHAAENCLTGAGWDIVRQYKLAVSADQPDALGTVLETRDKDGRGMVEYYMFVNRQGVTANWFEQFQMLLRSRGRGEVACHFILNQRLAPTQTPAASAETLRSVAQQLLPYVERSLGE